MIHEADHRHRIRAALDRVGREVNAAAINKQPNDHAGLIEPIKLFQEG